MRAGIAYARELRWAVVPLHDVSAGRCSCSKGAECKSAGKHPRIEEWEKEATADLAKITEWANRWPSANVGVATGTPSGFFVLDVDPDKGGFESFKALTDKYGPLPRTAQATTGSAGAHFLFKMPPGLDLRNTASKLGPGLDTRATGGQIVVAPSRSSKGPYTWNNNPLKGEPIADAPAWLLELLTTVAVTAAPAPPESRGFFPPASREVLEQAHDALEAHGPAIDGQGGGLHTVHAAAILTHDFALTDAEAWPLFVEWNKTARPPWELEGANSLRVMLGRGRKYGKGEYGSKRALDVQARLQKLIADSLGGDPMALVEAARPLFKQAGDVTRHALMVRELEAATGLKAKVLDLPRPQGVSKPAQAGNVEVTVKVHEVADKATAVIADDVFVRSGVLCEVVKTEELVICDLEVPRLVDLMSRRATWVRREADGGLVSQVPPENVARILSSRREHHGIRPLLGVTNAPIFLPDGSILQERGYSPAARLWLEPDVQLAVPDAPTHADAAAALAAFDQLLVDFNLLEAADRSAWIAGVMSPLVKSAIGNSPVPLVAVSASSPGAGKSLLTNIASLIITGHLAMVRPYKPRDRAEWDKSITSYVREGKPINVFDNCNGAFGDESLDRLITSTVWGDRTLGASVAPAVPITSCWWATGNNIEPHGDTVRRCLFVRIDVRDEKPQERDEQAFKIPDIEAHVRQYRGYYLQQLLTILRAYHVAGRPAQKLTSWGSFTAWSNLVRGALVWAGAADPMVTQRRAAAQLTEPDNEAHDFWLSIINDAETGRSVDVVALANSRDACGVLGIRDPITVHSLRKFINRFVDKPRGGLRIRREGQVYSTERLP